MALINPSNLYSGGQGILDSNRYVNFIANHEAKKQAQEEASTQYFAKLPEKLNLAGVRKQDLLDPETGRGITKEIEDWQTEWMRNKELIKKGGLPQQQYMAKFQQIANNIQKSKDRAKFELELGKSKFEGKFSPRQKDMGIITAIGKSIYDPNSYKPDGVSEYGFQDLSAAVGTMQPKDLLTFKKAAIGANKPEYDAAAGGIRMGDSGKILVTKRYKPETIKSIGEQAAALASTSGKAQNYFEDLMEIPEEVEKATKALQQFVGPNELPDTPAKMAKGIMMAEALAYKAEEEEKDVEAERRFRKQMQDERLAAALRNLKLREAGKNARLKTMMEGEEIDDVLGKAKAMASNVPAGIFGEEMTIIPLDNMDEIEKQDMLGKKDRYGNYEMKPFTAGNSTYLKLDSNGNVLAENGVISQQRVLNNTFNRTKGLKKSLYKKEVVLPGQTNATKKANTLNATNRRKP